VHRALSNKIVALILSPAPSPVLAFPAWSWPALAFSAGGDGGRQAPEVLATVLRFALWLAAYVIVGLLLAVFVQSFVNWFLSATASFLIALT
jgi:hypothetical protein